MAEIDRVDLGEKIKISSMYFCNFRYYLHIRERRRSSYEQTWIPFTQGCLMPKLVLNCPFVLEEKNKKKGKVSDNNDADDGTG